jgi:hypothetical protein
VEPTAGLDAVERRKILPCKEIKNKVVESKDNSSHAANLCIATAAKHSNSKRPTVFLVLL